MTLLNCYPPIIDILERLYIEDKLPNKNAYAEFMMKNFGVTTYNRHSQTICEVERKIMPMPPVPIYHNNHNREMKNGALEYLSYLFDKSKYKTLIDSLLSLAGNDNITVKEMWEQLHDLEYFCPISIAELAVDRRLLPNQCVKDFLKLLIVRNFQLTKYTT